MIVDSLPRYSCYSFGPAWDKAFGFLRSLAPDCKAGRHEIEGEDIFALVSEYTTKAYSDARLESHCRYADLQVLLSGEEIIGYAPALGLKMAGEFDEAKDIVFYESAVETGRTLLTPGLFSVYFPHDAHAPGINSGVACSVKKVVIKIRANLLLPGCKCG
jgi:biofilm protein TabA